MIDWEGRLIDAQKQYVEQFFYMNNLSWFRNPIEKFKAILELSRLDNEVDEAMRRTQ